MIYLANVKFIQVERKKKTLKFDLKNRHFMKLFYYSTEKVDFTENSFLSKKAKKEKLTLYSVENEKFGLTTVVQKRKSLSKR